MFRLFHSVPFSPLTRQYCRKMDWTRTMTKSTCASCLGWAIEETRVSPCMTVSRHYSKNWDFKSSLSRMKMIHMETRRTTTTAWAETPPTRIAQIRANCADVPDELPSIPCMMQRMKIHKRSDRAERQCLALISANAPSWKYGLQPEPLQGSPKRRRPTLRPQNRRHYTIGGIG